MRTIFSKVRLRLRDVVALVLFLMATSIAEMLLRIGVMEPMMAVAGVE